MTNNKINASEKCNFLSVRVLNIVGKGENAGYHNVFERFLSQGQ